MFEYQSIDALTDYLLEQHSEALRKQFKVGSSAPMRAALPAVARRDTSVAGSGCLRCRAVPS